MNGNVLSKISIINRANISKNIFRNEETNQMVISQFFCCNCGFENQIEVTPYETGFPILQIYNEEIVLSKKELLENKMLTKTSHWMQHLGELTINDLPTLYFGTDCKNCGSKYIGIFCFGEKQPGLTILEISGVWQYEIKTV